MGFIVLVRENDSLGWWDDVRLHITQPGGVYALLGSAAFGGIQLQHVIHQVQGQPWHTETQDNT